MLRSWILLRCSTQPLTLQILLSSSGKGPLQAKISLKFCKAKIRLKGIHILTRYLSAGAATHQHPLQALPGAGVLPGNEKLYLTLRVAHGLNTSCSYSPIKLLPPAQLFNVNIADVLLPSTRQ